MRFRNHISIFLAAILLLAFFSAPAYAVSHAQAGIPQPVAFTSAMPVRGAYLPASRSYAFLGVPYARVASYFTDAVPLEPTNAVFDATSLGAVSPQTNLFADQTVPYYGNASNDCLNLNIWTPSLSGGLRPVIVQFHGGGLSCGSAGVPEISGANLAGAENCVVVNVNHRLNVFGFLNLSDYGEKYANSQNQGIRDLVMALRWVKANAPAFGGDPDNVTVMGQSGGGIKVLALMSCPDADGLFQKAVIQSAITEQYDGRFHSEALSKQIAANVLKRLSVDPDDIDAIQSKSIQEIQAAAARALLDTADQNGVPSLGSGARAIGWTPVLDDRIIAADPSVSGFPAWTDEIPLLVGSTLSEWNTATRPQNVPASGENGLTAAYRAAFFAYPGVSVQPWAVDTRFRNVALSLADAKAAQSAPVYNYVWTYTWAHCSELPVIFRNTASTGPYAACTAGSAMSSMASALWASFARDGSPSCQVIRAWPAFAKDSRGTMSLGLQPRFAVDHDKELLRILSTWENM